MKIIVLRGWRQTAFRMFQVTLGLAAIGAGVAVARSLPDVARYLRMRRM